MIFNTTSSCGVFFCYKNHIKNDLFIKNVKGINIDKSLIIRDLQ